MSASTFKFQVVDVALFEDEKFLTFRLDSFLLKSNDTSLPFSPPRLNVIVCAGVKVPNTNPKRIRKNNYFISLMILFGVLMIGQIPRL